MDCVTKNKRLVIHFDTVFLMLEWQSFNFKEVGASKDTSVMLCLESQQNGKLYNNMRVL